jgi:molybdopterin-guanine dinucleotide biosynthesis protein A
MPFLSSALLRKLVAVKDADLVIPRHAGRYEPLCALYSRACADDIRERLARGMNEASTLPAGLRVTAIDVDNERFFVNVNTPHDYERAKGLSE